MAVLIDMDSLKDITYQIFLLIYYLWRVDY